MIVSAESFRDFLDDLERPAEDIPELVALFANQEKPSCHDS